MSSPLSEPLQVGDRVRHYGEQYVEALDGTAHVLAILTRDEVLVAADKPPFWTEGTTTDMVRQWPRWATVKVHEWDQ